MNKHIVLIDYENVQPSEIGQLNHPQVDVKIFMGSVQKLSVERMNQGQALGPRLEYIQIQGSGRNALDFHIAFYIGLFSRESPGAIFHIVSKDTGFAPLIKHLGDKGITCYRSATFSRIVRLVKDQNAEASPEVMPTKPGELLTDIMQRIGENLRKNRPSKPGTRKRLMNFIKGYLKEGGEGEILQVVEYLVAQRIIIISKEEKVSYGSSATPIESTVRSR